MGPAAAFIKKRRERPHSMGPRSNRDVSVVGRLIFQLAK